MGVGVMGDRVAFGGLAARKLRRRLDLAADGEKGGAHAFGGERLQHLRRGRGVRPVVEGQDHLMIGERNFLADRF